MAQLTSKSGRSTPEAPAVQTPVWGAGPALPEAVVLAVALAVYALRAAWAVAGHWNRINPDAVCYIRQAHYLLQGRYTDAVAGYWSPLVSWCLAPFVALGLDELHALYGVVAVWGGVLVLSSAVLVRRLTGLPATWRLVVLLFIGDATLRWGATGFPDVILAACLMSAAAILAHPAFLHHRRLQVACGVLGGLGYLGKAYGMPYFVLFIPLGLVLLHADEVPSPGRRRRLLSAWLTVMLAFLAISLPWVGALSIKFQRPTFGLVGPINHAIIGPDDYTRDELWHPVPGRITVWEIPETRDYRFWSPLESGEHLRHQVKYSLATARKVRGSLANFDFLALSLGLVIAAPLLLMAMGERREVFRMLWVAMVMATYSLPFILVYYDYRYVTPFLKPLCIMACFNLAWVAGRHLDRAISSRWKRSGWLQVPAWGLFMVVTLSFALHLNVPFSPYQVQEVDGTPYNDIVTDISLHRTLAGQLRAAGVDGPLAATHYWGGLYVAFTLDTPFVGSPAGATFADCRAELAARGVGVFLMDPDWIHAAAFQADPSWQRVLTLDGGEAGPILVLVAVTDAAPTGSS